MLIFLRFTAMYSLLVSIAIYVKELIPPPSPIKTILIEIDITKEQLGYRFWGTDYYPDSFSITIDDKNIDILVDSVMSSSSKNIVVPVKNNYITLGYAYNFKSGLYKGYDTITIPLDASAKNSTVGFCWYADSHKRLFLQNTKTPTETVVSVKK